MRNRCSRCLHTRSRRGPRNHWPARRAACITDCHQRRQETLCDLRYGLATGTQYRIALSGSRNLSRQSGDVYMYWKGTCVSRTPDDWNDEVSKPWPLASISSNCIERQFGALKHRPVMTRSRAKTWTLHLQVHVTTTTWRNTRPSNHKKTSISAAV